MHSRHDAHIYGKIVSEYNELLPVLDCANMLRMVSHIEVVLELE